MAWGGSRPGAGRKKANPNRPRQVAQTIVRPAETKVTPAVIPAEAKREIDYASMLPMIEEISQRYAVHKAREKKDSPFRLPQFPKSVTDGLKKANLSDMAMDSNISTSLGFGTDNWLAGDVFGGLPASGLVFLGYTYLSELAQQPEYRIMSETIADDATRKWIDFDVTGDEKQLKEAAAKDPAGQAERMADPDEKRKRVAAAGKSDKVKELQDDQLRLQVKDRYYEQARNGGFFGRTHLFHDIRLDNSKEIDTEDLKASIGDSRDTTSRSKVPKGSFHALRTIEPVWTYPLMYNAVNPLREDWYNPQVWFVQGQEIHGTRLQTFIPHPVPDMLKPAYAFGGLSLSQMAKPYVDRWLTTVTSVNQLIHSFSVMVLMTDLSTLIQPGSVAQLVARVAMFNMFRDNQGAFVINNKTEDFKNVSASLAGLHELQAQSQEHIASINRIPLVKYTGIQPAGLNASSEGEIEVYDDTIQAYQGRVLDANLRRTINFEQLSLWGEIDPEITHSWNQLRPMSQAEKGQKEKDDADRNQKYVDMGAIAPGEVRKVIIDDKDLPYTGLNPDDVPEPPAEEGLLGPGAGGAATEHEKEADGQGGEDPPEKPGGGATDADVPFAFDAWNEGDHPRGQPGNSGQFGSGGSGPSSSKQMGEGSAGGPHSGGKAGKFAAKGKGNLKDQGFKPKKRGAGNSITEAAQVAWGHAIATGKAQTLVPSPMTNGYVFLKPGERLPYGTPHVVVDPDGTVTNYAVAGPKSPGASQLYQAPSKSADEIVAAFPGGAEAIARTRDRLAKVIPSDALVSEGGFKNPDGTYTPEREAIHRQIANDFFKPEAVARALPKPGEKPVLTMLGGRGGSGKSWLTGENGPVDENTAILVDADAVKAKLPGYEGWNASAFHEESSDILKLIDARALELGVNTIHDATMKSEATAAMRMAQYEAAGYEVEGYYMYAAPETAATRAMSRYSKKGTFTGRFVPPEIILGNVNNEKNFDKLSGGFRKWAVYDNNAEGQKEPKLVSRSWDD